MKSTSSVNEIYNDRLISGLLSFEHSSVLLFCLHLYTSKTFCTTHSYFFVIQTSISVKSGKMICLSSNFQRMFSVPITVVCVKVQ